MSEEDKHKLSKILYYSDIHPADTDFINNIIFNLCQERNIAKSILTELEEYLQKHIEEWGNSEDEYMMGVIAEDKDILNKLKEEYK